MDFAPINYSPLLHFTHIEGFGHDSRPFRVGWVTPLDEEDFDVRSSLLSKCLFGAFVDYRTFDEFYVGSKLKNFCKLAGNVSVEKHEGFYLFQFDTQEDKAAAFQHSPLSIDGGFLTLKDFVPTMQVTDLRFDPVGVWVQAHGLPFVHQHNHMAFKLAAQIGALLDIDWVPDGRLLPEKSFLRFKVIIYPGDPLIPGVYVPIGDNRFVWVKFSYERVGKVCMRCGRIGHSVSHCSFPPTVMEDDLRKSFSHTKQFHGQRFLADETRPLFDRDILAKHSRIPDFNSYYKHFVSFEEDLAALSSSSESGDSSYHTASSNSSSSGNGLLNSLHGRNKHASSSRGHAAGNDEWASDLSKLKMGNKDGLLGSSPHVSTVGVKRSGQSLGLHSSCPGPILTRNVTHVRQIEKVLSPPPGFESRKFSATEGSQLHLHGTVKELVPSTEGPPMRSILEVVPFRSGDFTSSFAADTPLPAESPQSKGSSKRKRSPSLPEVTNKPKGSRSSVPVSPSSINRNQSLLSRKRKGHSSEGDIFPLPSVFQDLIDAWEGTLYDSNGLWLAAPDQPPSGE